MALGGNLKKKTLIPAEEAKKESKPAKPKKKVSTTATKKATKPTKKVVKKRAKKVEEKPAKKITKEKEAPKQPAPAPVKAVTPAPLAEPVQVSPPALPRAPLMALREGLISKTEYERRQKLHERFHQEVMAMKGRNVHLIVFRIEQEEFAIEISKVNEVVVTPEITRMPQAPKYVPGIATIRGKGVVTLDLAYKLGYVPDSQGLKDRSAYTIVIKTSRFGVGLLVPDVPKNQIINGDIVQPAADNISETSLDETYIKGLFRIDGRMIFFIDIDEMIEGDRLKSRLVEV